MTYKIGDRIQMHNPTINSNRNLPIGTQGTVVYIPDYMQTENSIIFVEWDVPPHAGHSCDGHAKPGYGWKVRANEIRPASSTDPASPIPEELSILYGE